MPSTKKYNPETMKDTDAHIADQIKGRKIVGVTFDNNNEDTGFEAVTLFLDGGIKVRFGYDITMYDQYEWKGAGATVRVSTPEDVLPGVYEF